MLAHQSGLAAWIPFWKETIKKNGKFRRNTISTEYSEKFPFEVATGLYIYKKLQKQDLF